MNSKFKALAMITSKPFFYDLIKDKKVFYSVVVGLLLFFASCGGSPEDQPSSEKSSQETDTKAPEASVDPMQNKGIGPVDHVELSAEVDAALAAEGKTIFEENCTACHKMEKRYVGPALGGVTERRSPEWIMNMILNPGEMVQKDPIAKELLAEYLAPMAAQSLTREEVRAMLEYFREYDKNNETAQN